MSAISQKSISGITSITSPAGTDDQISLHTSNTNEALKIDGAGNLHLNNHVNTTGVSTASNFKTGSSNLHSTGLTVGDSFVHSTGFNVGSNIKLGTTGIITATSFVGDGSDLTNLPAGLGTALSATASSPLNKMYYTNQVLGVPSSITVDVPASASKAYTQYADIKVDGSADLIVAEGDDLIPDVLGLADFGTFGGGASAGRIRVNSISNAANDGSPTVQKGLVVTGVCTATSFAGDGSALTGIAADKIFEGNTEAEVVDTGSDGHFKVTTEGSERLRILSDGKVGIGSVIPANSLDVQGTAHAKIHIGTTGTSHATGIQINHAKGNAALQEWQLQTDASADGNLIVRNATSGTSTMFFDADTNNVGINVTNPDRKLHVGGSFIRVDDGYGLDTSGATERVTLDNGFITLTTNSNERVRIDSSGRLLIGTTATDNRDGYNSAVQIAGTTGDGSSMCIGRYSANTSYPALVFSKSRNASINSHTRLNTGDQLGGIQFQGDDGTRFLVGASIYAQAASPVADYDMATDMVFSTNYGTTSPTKSMTLDQQGRLTKPNQPFVMVHINLM